MGLPSEWVYAYAPAHLFVDIAELPDDTVLASDFVANGHCKLRTQAVLVICTGIPTGVRVLTRIHPHAGYVPIRHGYLSVMGISVGKA